MVLHTLTAPLRLGVDTVTLRFVANPNTPRTQRTKPPEPKPLDARLDAWERQPGEHEKAFAAFAAYRDAAQDRSVRATARDLKVWPTQLQRWVVQWRWYDRVAEYDRHMDRVRVREARKVLVEMTTRHSTLAMSALGVLSRPINELIERINSKKINLATIPDAALLRMVRDAAAAIKDLVEVERVARGAPASTSLVVEADENTVASAVERMFSATTYDTPEDHSEA